MFLKAHICAQNISIFAVYIKIGYRFNIFQYERLDAQLPHHFFPEAHIEIKLFYTLGMKLVSPPMCPFVNFYVN